MSEDKGFPTLKPPGTLPKISSIFDFSAEALGELMTYIAQNPPPIPISQIIGYQQSGVLILDRLNTATDVQNTGAETTLYSFLVPAGEMSTNKTLRLSLSGDLLHNNAAGDTITVRIKFGGTTFFQSTGSNLGNITSATRQPWESQIRVSNLGATNSQKIGGWLMATQAQGPTTGIGALRTVATEMNFVVGVMAGNGLGSIDTSVAQTLSVTVQWNAASANNSFRIQNAILELI